MAYYSNGSSGYKLKRDDEEKDKNPSPSATKHKEETPEQPKAAEPAKPKPNVMGSAAAQAANRRGLQRTVDEYSKGVKQTVVEAGELDLPDNLEKHRNYLDEQNKKGKLKGSGWTANTISVDTSSIKDVEQLAFYSRTLESDADRKAVAKDWARRNKLSESGVLAYLENRHMPGVNAGAFDKAQTDGGKLKAIGLYTLEGDELDLDTVSPDTVVQAIRDIADSEEREAAVKLFQKMTKDKDSRFYGYNSYSQDYSFRDSAVLTSKKYKDYVSGLAGKFDPREDKLEQSLRKYLAEYEKLEKQGGYILAQEGKALKAAFEQQMGAAAPDVAELRRILDGAAAPDTKSGRQAAGGEPEQGGETEEAKTGFFDGFKEGLAAWWHQNKTGAPSEEETTESAEVTPTPVSRSDGGSAGTMELPFRRAASAGGSDAQLFAAPATGTLTVPTFSRPVQEENEPIWIPGAKEAATKKSEVAGPTQRTDLPGSVDMSDNMVGAYVQYIAKGKGDLLNEDTVAKFDEFVSSPEMRALFGILDDSTGKEARAGNENTRFAVYSQSELLGPLNKYTERIHSKDFMGDLSDAAMSAIIDLVYKASSAPLTREEAALIENGKSNRCLIYCEKHPKELAAVEAAVALSDEQNRAALGQKIISTQQALSAAQKRCRTGYGTEADWSFVTASAPVYSPADRHQDKSYVETQALLQQAFDASGEQAWAAADAAMWAEFEGTEVAETEYDWFNEQTLLYLAQNGFQQDLTSKEAACFRGDLLDYTNEVLADEHDKAHMLGYASVGEMWASTGTGTLEDIQAKAVSKYEADLRAASEPEEVEEPQYQGTGEIGTGTVVAFAGMTGAISNVADVQRALAVAGIVTDNEYERFEVRDLYYRTGSFATAEARCKKDLYAMLDGGYFPDETLAKYVRDYLDNGGVALDLGIMPSKLGWALADNVNLSDKRLKDFQAWAQENYTPGQGKASELIAGAVYNTIDQAESLLLQLPIMAAPGLAVTGMSAPGWFTSALGRFMARTLAFSAAYGAPTYVEGVDIALEGGADFKGANMMGQSMTFAQAVSEMYTDTKLAESVFGSMGVTDAVTTGMENLGVTPTRRFLRATGLAIGKTLSGAFEEAGHDEFFGGVGKGVAQAATWKTIQTTNGLTELPNLSDWVKIAGAAMQGGVEAIGPTTKELIDNFGANFIASIPITLLSGTAVGVKDWNSTRAVKKAANTGDHADVADAGAAMVEDMSDPQKAAVIDEAAFEAHVGMITNDILLHDEGEIGAMADNARKVKEQADSHQAAYVQARSVNQQAQKTLADAQAQLNAGDTSDTVRKTIADAQEAYQQSMNNMDESWREYQEKKAESDVLHAEAYKLARNEASKRVQQERADLAKRIQTEQNAVQADQELNNSLEMEAEDWLNAEHQGAPEEEQARLKQRYIERAKQKAVEQSVNEQTQEAPRAEGDQQLTPEERQRLMRRDRFARQVSKRNSVNIDFVDRKGDILKGNRGAYSKEKNTIYLPSDATQSDVVKAVFAHELTHRAQESGHYRAMADALLEWKYGDDKTKLKSDKDNLRKIYEPQYQDSKARREEFAKNGGSILETEQVARIAEELVTADEEALTRLVTQKPTIARKIADAIKNVLDKLRGVRDPQMDAMRRAERYMRKALDEVEKKHRKEYERILSESKTAGEAVPGDLQLSSEDRAILEAEAEKRYIKLTSKLTGDPTSDEMLAALTRLADGDKLTLEEVQALPEVADAYAKVGDVDEQIKQNAPMWETETPEAIEALSNLGSAVKNEKGKYEYTGEVRQEHRLDIVIGPPAAGKSSVLADPLSEKYHSRIIDSDMAKERLSGYRDGLGAGVVHEESGVIKDAVIERCVERGDNIVLPIIGDKPAKLTRQIQWYKELGYDVYLHLNELPSGKAIGRALNRYLATGRFIDPVFLFGYGDKPSSSYDEVTKTEGLLSGYSKYSNDVKFGEQPIFLGGTENLSADGGTDGLRGERSRGESAAAPSGEAPSDIQYAAADDDLIDQQIDAWIDRLGGRNAVIDPGNAPQGERQFAVQTSQRSEAMPEWVKENLFNDPQSRYYMKDSNVSQLTRGWNRVQQDGYTQTRDRLLQVERMEPDDVAAANIIMLMANRNNDVETMMLMAHKYNEDGTLIGQAMQARKLFSSMSPTALKMKMAGKYEAKTAEYMETHKANTKAIKERAKKVSEKLATMAGEDELLKLAQGNYSINSRSFDNKWNVPINDRQRELIKHYKLENTPRPGDNYNRATTKQRMLEAILMTPDPTLQTGLGLNLVDRLEMMNEGLAVVTIADLDYIERNMRTYCSLSDETDFENGRAGDIALSRVYEAYGNVDPATFGEKLKTWSYVAMLTSVPSAARNIVGNTTMNAVSGVADGLAVTLDQIVSLKTGNRTRAHLTAKQRSEGWWAFADETVNTFRDFFVDKTIVRNGNEKFDMNARGRVYQPMPVLGDTPEALRLMEGFLMSVGDRNFWKKKFFNSISEQMNLAEKNGTEFDYESAAQIAINEANYATFTEDSKVIKALSMLKRSEIGWGVHFLIPFTGVPTNILTRPIQFSPVGIVATLTKAAVDKAGNNDFDQRSFVDGLARGITGTTLMLIGMELLRKGILHLGTSEDEEELYNLNTAQGEQYTAFLQLGGKNISLSTFSPAASALIMGGYLARELDNNVAWYNAVGSACLESYDTILDASYLSSLADFMEAWKEDGTAGMFKSLASSAVSMNIPAALGQLADHFDPYTRDTKDANALKAMYNAVLNKIPFARETLPAKVDITGQKIESKPAWSVFLQPLTVTDVRNDAVLNELERLWREDSGYVTIPSFLVPNTGKISILKTVVDEMPGMEWKPGGVKVTLNNEQRVKYNELYGQRVFEAIRLAMDDPSYQYGEDSDKAEILETLKDNELQEIKLDILREICTELGFN